jgi:hypothetical protein
MARPPFIDANVLRMALVGYAQEREKIEVKIAEIHAQLGTATTASTVTAGAAPRKRRLSAAARKRISQATRKRWAAYRKEKAKQQHQQ